MALIYNKIVESNIEPSPNNLWLKDGQLLRFKDGWKPVSLGDISNSEITIRSSEWGEGTQDETLSLQEHLEFLWHNILYILGSSEGQSSTMSLRDRITNIKNQETTTEE